MKYVIKQSKSVEDAVEDALLELNASPEEVEVEVLEEPSKGLFGFIGGKEAIVKVSLTRDLTIMAKEFLDYIVTSMGIKANIVAMEVDDTLNVDIRDVNPRDKGIIIGKRGNTLDAIQYLLSLNINRDNMDYIRVIIDVEGYRKKREDTLIRLARRMADKAIRSKRAIKLEPMNPYERRIIHSCLQNYGDVTTFSEGSEPYRKVVIQST